MSKKNLTPQQRWQKKNKDIVSKSKAEYDKKNPVWGIRPDEELREWLREEKVKDVQDKLESNAAVVIRLLNLLKILKKDKELNEWLEEAREENESFISVVIRKLKKLMKIERENK